MVAFRQYSFAAGELSPELYSRFDFERHAQGLRKLRNFIVTPRGAAMNRPGFRYCGSTKNDAAVRLIPFVFSDDQAYVLEFGNLYIRIWFDGELVAVASVPTEVVTTYTSAQLSRIKYTQSGDVLTLVHPSHPPRQLTRTAGLTPQTATWQLADIAFATRAAVAPASRPTMPAYPPYSPDDSHPAKGHTLVVTAIDPTTGEESFASDPTIYDPFVLYPDRPVTFTWPASATPNVTEYLVYRGTSGIRGYVGSASGTTFRDDGQAPDYNQLPPAGTNPFNASNKYPSTVAYFQERLVFGGTTERPMGIWMSKVGYYRVFDASPMPIDDDPLTFQLIQRRYEEIRTLTPFMNALIAGASGAIWGISGRDQGPIIPTDIGTRVLASTGSGWLDPVLTGDSLLFLDARSNTVRDMAFDYAGDAYKGDDVAVFASHLFDGHELTDWAYARVPHSVLWAVRDDGKLIALTYKREHDVRAWHWHDTDGEFENVCVIPEGTEDVLYAVVNRTIDGETVRYVERLASRTAEDVRDWVFLDSSVSADGRNEGATTMTVTGSTWTAGSELTVTASVATFESANVGSNVVLDPDGDTSGPIRLRITSYTSTTVVTCEAEADVPAAFQATATTSWGIGYHQVGGLDHLEGEEVYVLGDGSVQGPFTVEDGSIDLVTPAAVVHAGLPYTPELETLDLATQPDARGRKKIIRETAFEVFASRGLKAGEDFDTLFEHEQRQVSDGYSAIERDDQELVKVIIAASWNEGGRAVLRQSYPLPLTVFSVIRDVDFGG